MHVVTRPIAFAGALAAALLLNCCSRSTASTAGQRADSTIPIVPVARVVRGNIASKTVLTAEFQPFQEVDVMAKVAGYVRAIHVDLGDRVQEGQVLAELEIPEMTNEVAKAAAMVEQTESEIAAAKDELQRAESAHQIAHLSYARLQEVLKREAGLIPLQEVDESHSRDLVLEAQVASAKSRLRVEENKTRVAQAEEARLRTLRNYISIAAPFAGTVTKRYANAGSMIQAGTASQSQAMPLVRLSQVGTLRLEPSGSRIDGSFHSPRRARGGAGRIPGPQLRGTGCPVCGKGGSGHANHDYRSGCSEPHRRHHARYVCGGLAASGASDGRTDRALGWPGAHGRVGPRLRGG